MRLTIILIDETPADRQRTEAAVREVLDAVRFLVIGDFDDLETACGQPRIDLLICPRATSWASGFEILQRLRQSAPYAAAVMLAADGNEAVAADAILSGFDSYVPRTEAGWARLPAAVINALARVERRRTLELESALLRTVLDSVFDAIITTDERGRILTVNHTTEQMTGYSASEMIGNNVSMLISGDDRERHDAYVARSVVEGNSPAIGRGRELRLMRKDRSEIPVEIGLTRAQFSGRPLFTGAIRDIAERKGMERALVDALARASAGDQAKTAFLRNMSHELRTPLNAVIGFAETLLHAPFGPLGDPHYVEYADAIVSSGRHLFSLVQQIFDMAQIEGSGIDLERERLDLANSMHEVAKIMARQIDIAGLALTVDVPPERPDVHADPRAIRQILLNLLSNALKNTHKGGTITLALTEEARGMALSVADTGQGIAPELLPHLGKPFVRQGEALIHSGGGIGLGLAIVRGLIDAHGGKLEFDSRVGAGTVVRVILPLYQASTPGSA